VPEAKHAGGACALRAAYMLTEYYTGRVIQPTAADHIDSVIRSGA